MSCWPGTAGTSQQPVCRVTAIAFIPYVTLQAAYEDLLKTAESFLRDKFVSLFKDLVLVEPIIHLIKVIRSSTLMISPSMHNFASSDSVRQTFNHARI